MEQWRAETKAIIDANHVNAKNYASVVGDDWGAWVKSRGGVFTKCYGHMEPITTVQQLRDRQEYVSGLMAIHGFCYWNGKTWWWWKDKASLSFYQTKQTAHCREGTIGQLCTGKDGRTRITCCNYGVDTLLWQCGIYSLKKTTVTDKSKLKPGDVIDLYKVSTGKWHHQIIVISIDKTAKKIWCADYGNRFIRTGKPLHYMSLTGKTAGGEYGNDRWKGRHRLTLKEEKPELIKRNTGFRGYNVSPRTVAPKWIVIHYTGSEGTASDNVAYFNGGNRDASADIFIGHQGEILAYNNDISHQYTWHCGGSLESAYHPYYGVCTNGNSIGVELCTHNEGGKWTFTGSTIASAVTVVKHLMKLYNIDADHVIRHYDVTGKACPRVPGWGAVGGDAEWIKFKDKLVGKGDIVVVPKTIKMGSTGVRVKWLQTFLGGLKVDGKYGKVSRAKFMTWQKNHKDVNGNPLKVDGECGPKSWMAIFKSLS